MVTRNVLAIHSKITGNVSQLHEVQEFVTAYFLIKQIFQSVTAIPLNLASFRVAVGKSVLFSTELSENKLN